MINKNSLFYTKWPSFDEGCLTALSRFLDQHPNCRAIFIDTLAKVRRTPSHKGNLYYEDTEAISALKDIADRYSVAIVLVHHVNKKESDDPLDLISGSNGIAGAADTLIVLQRSRKTGDATLFVTGREVDSKEFSMLFDKSCRWTILGEADEVRATKVHQEIMEAITDAGHPIGPTEIGRATGKRAPSLGKTLKLMLVKGLISHLEGGKYQVVEQKTPKFASKDKNGGKGKNKG